MKDNLLFDGFVKSVTSIPVHKDEAREDKKCLYRERLAPTIENLLEIYAITRGDGLIDEHESTEPPESVEAFVDKICSDFTLFYEQSLPTDLRSALESRATSIADGFATAVKTVVSLAEIYEEKGLNADHSSIRSQILRSCRWLANVDLESSITIHERLRKSDNNDLWDPGNFSVGNDGELEIRASLAAEILDTCKAKYESGTDRIGCPVIAIIEGMQNVVELVLNLYASAQDRAEMSAEERAWADAGFSIIEET